MEGFKAGILDIEPYELCHFLLQETGQYDRDAVNPVDLLEYLQLEYLSFDFDTGLPPEAKEGWQKPRALLSFPDKLVAVDEKMKGRRGRFSILHETAHYVLPSHQHAFYLCDSVGLSSNAKFTYEKEANDFAANLLFKGGAFTTEAAQLPVSVKSIKNLAEKYKASYESSARRFVEKSLKPIMLIVFKETACNSRAELDGEQLWKVKYSNASASFRTRFFSRIKGHVPPKIAKKFKYQFGDIADTEKCDVIVSEGEEKKFHLHAEYFFNQYNIMCLLTPNLNCR